MYLPEINLYTFTLALINNTKRKKNVNELFMKTSFAIYFMQFSFVYVCLNKPRCFAAMPKGVSAILNVKLFMTRNIRKFKL